jgi:hypothetical protein
MACWVSVNDATSCRSSSIHRLIGVTSFGDFKARLSIISTAFIRKRNHPQRQLRAPRCREHLNSLPRAELLPSRTRFSPLLEVAGGTQAVCAT